MEIAICQLLLGCKAEALSTLGVLEGASNSADSAPDSGILDFIQVCCQIGSANQHFTSTMGLVVLSLKSNLQVAHVSLEQYESKDWQQKGQACYVALERICVRSDSPSRVPRLQANKVPSETANAYLQGHASEDGDLTPGLIAMAQSWVEDVALPSFRAGGASLAPLEAWFGCPQVKLYLMVRASTPSHTHPFNLPTGPLLPQGECWPPLACDTERGRLPGHGLPDRGPW